MAVKKKEPEMDFEKAMARLEEIAGMLESGGESLSLEKSLELYEEGSKLAALCTAKLRGAEQRITELSAKAASDNGPADGGAEEQ